MQRFLGGKFGSDFAERRKLYHGKFLAKIAYAAPAWFLHDPTRTASEPRMIHGLTLKALGMLQKLQNEMLKALTRARTQTNGPVMEHELHVLPILLQLHRIAMDHRVLHQGSEHYNELHRNRQYRGTIDKAVRVKSLKSHPYNRLHELVVLHLEQIHILKQQDLSAQAFQDEWAIPKTRKKWIKAYHYDLVFHKAEKAFSIYLRSRAHRHQHFHPAHNTKFIDHVLRCYAGLKPAQCTMTIQMRTGNIALKTNYFHRQTLNTNDMTCPLCEKALHTAEHLLCHCSALELPRQHLRAAVGHTSWARLMTEECEIASAFAIRYFEIEQFDSEKEKRRYQFPRTRFPRD